MFELRPYRKSSVSYYNPFREMADLERSFWGDPDSRNALAEFKTDITDEGDHFLLEADMPGFDKKDIRLEDHSISTLVLSGCFSTFFGRVRDSTPLLYLALIPAASMPVMSKLRL